MGQDADRGQGRPAGSDAPAGKAPHILVPRFKTMPRWFERELRTGGLIHNYLERERHNQERACRRAARDHGTKRPNPKSDFKLVAQIPANLFQRWKKVDKHFWMDDNNLRSLRRDNEALRPLIHV